MQQNEILKNPFFCKIKKKKNRITISHKWPILSWFWSTHDQILLSLFLTNENSMSYIRGKRKKLTSENSKYRHIWRKKKGSKWKLQLRPLGLHLLRHSSDDIRPLLSKDYAETTLIHFCCIFFSCCNFFEFSTIFSTKMGIVAQLDQCFLLKKTIKRRVKTNFRSTFPRRERKW